MLALKPLHNVILHKLSSLRFQLDEPRWCPCQCVEGVTDRVILNKVVRVVSLDVSFLHQYRPDNIRVLLLGETFLRLALYREFVVNDNACPLPVNEQPDDIVPVWVFPEQYQSRDYFREHVGQRSEAGNKGTVGDVALDYFLCQELLFPFLVFRAEKEPLFEYLLQRKNFGRGAKRNLLAVSFRVSDELRQESNKLFVDLRDFGESVE